MTKKQIKYYSKKILELEKLLYKNISKEEKLKVQNKMDNLTEEIIGLDGGLDNLLDIDEYIQKFLEK